MRKSLNYRNNRNNSGKGIRRLVSAGGVVYRVVDGKIQTPLCVRKKPPQWSLPKGTPDDGETIEETALREVREETGLEVSIKGPIDSINYWFFAPGDRVRCYKTVHFYLMNYLGGSVDLHDPEFDEVMWVDPEDALNKLTHANEVKIMEKALAMTTGENSR